MPIRRRNWNRKAMTVASAELDEKYKRLRRLGAKLAHKAQWHNKRNAPNYASAECCPPLRGRRGFPQALRRGGTAIGKTHEERGKMHLIIFLEMPACPERGGNCI